MKTKKYMRCILCEGVTLAESVKIFNEEMEKLQDANPTFERYNDTFLIYVTVYEKIPENVVDKKELQGCSHTCSDCIHCQRRLTRKGEVNKVTKRATCDLKDMTIFIDSTVCEVFYEEHQDLKPRTYNTDVVMLSNREKEMKKGV